jgi:hypothetical protein
MKTLVWWYDNSTWNEIQDLPISDINGAMAPLTSYTGLDTLWIVNAKRQIEQWWYDAISTDWIRGV